MQNSRVARDQGDSCNRPVLPDSGLSHDTQPRLPHRYQDSNVASGECWKKGGCSRNHHPILPNRKTAKGSVKSC